MDFQLKSTTRYDIRDEDIIYDLNVKTIINLLAKMLCLEY